MKVAINHWQLIKPFHRTNNELFFFTPGSQLWRVSDGQDLKKPTIYSSYFETLMTKNRGLSKSASYTYL